MNELLRSVYDRVVGRKDEILMIVSALDAGKTYFSRRPSRKRPNRRSFRPYPNVPGGHTAWLPGNSDLTTSKLIGYFDPAETLAGGYKAEFFHPGPLLQAMKEGDVSLYRRVQPAVRRDGPTSSSRPCPRKSWPSHGWESFEAHPAFRIIAALNPLDDIGISRISRALKDRFSSIRMDYHSRDEEN